MFSYQLSIKTTANKGRGMFAETDIPADTEIDGAPVIVMSKSQRALLDQTALHDYIFEWGVDKDQCCMALGYIPIYNHSYKSNCEYFMDYGDESMTIKTVRAISAGEELTINYNGDWDDARKVWFEVAD